MVKYDDLFYVQILTQVEYGVPVIDYEFNKLIAEVERVNAEGTEIFAKDRKLKNLDYLLYLYISADKGLEETIGLKHALGTYIKGIFQSKLNHKALLKGINLTSINRIPANAATLVQQSEAVIDFDDECESLYQAILRASEGEYASEIGTNHQQMMADSRNKVKQLAKKYEKK
jgi:hypothetical protein